MTEETKPIHRFTPCANREAGCAHRSFNHGMSGVCMAEGCECQQFTPPEGHTYRMEYSGSDLVRVLADDGGESRVIAICRACRESDWSQVVKDARLIVDSLNAWAPPEGTSPGVQLMRESIERSQRQGS